MTETANVALECTEFVIVAFVFRSIESFKNVELRETHTHNRDFDRTEEEEDKKKTAAVAGWPLIFFFLQTLNCGLKATKQQCVK